jgi:hypothetical protein
MTEQERREAAGRLEVCAIPLEQPRADDPAVFQSHLGVDEAPRGGVELGVDRLGTIDADGRARARAAIEGEVHTRVEGPEGQAAPRIAGAERPQRRKHPSTVAAEHAVLDVIGREDQPVDAVSGATEEVPGACNRTSHAERHDGV